MRREWMAVLIGASMLAATDVEAQRGRDRESGRRGEERERVGRVEQLEPIRAPGRVVPAAAPRVRSRARPATHHYVDARSRVVYRSPAYRRYHRPAAWIRVDWGPRVRFRVVVAPRHGAYLSQGELRRLLGREAVRDIRDAGHSMGLRGSLRGHWVQARGVGAVLVVTMGGTDVAELVDYDRDGFVDDFFLVGPRAWRRAGW